MAAIGSLRSAGKKRQPIEEPVGGSPEEQLDRLWADPPGFLGWFASLQNDALGTRIMAVAFIFFLAGGVNALLIRLQLVRPQADIISAQTFNEAFTMHGSTMMFLFAVPMLEGFAILLLPFILGNRDMPYPRLGAFTFYIFGLGGLLFFSSYLFNAVPDDGWFAYTPLSGPYFSPGLEMDFWLLALGVAEVGAIAAGVEIIIAVLHMRAPGMSIGRIPIFAWAFLVMAVAIIFAFTTLFVTTMMLEADRHFGTQFYNPVLGGSVLLWQHLFWIFGHPEVYIQFIPAAGMVSMIVPVFSRQRLMGYNYVAMALVSTGFLSFALWAHHMFTVGLPQVTASFFSAASILIAIPAGVQIFSWIATIAAGRPVWRTPFLFVLGFLIIFVMGGVTGVMVGVAPFDWQVHDSYFVVAHFHYVLIGGVTFPVFAAFYYWFPKVRGRLLDERLGKLNFWLMFIGLHLTFFPMHIVGLLGMPRRYYTYLPGLGWDIYNLVSTVGAFILAAGILTFVVNLFYSLRNGEPAGGNPWGADSLEWATSSPPPSQNFTVLPIVRSRHPLWDQAELHSGEERMVRFTEALGRWPLHWRAAVTTSLVDAKPKEVFRLAGPSHWPLVVSVGLITIFAAEIFLLRSLVLGGGALMVIGLIGWHWPNRIPITEEELAFEREHGVEVRPNGSRTVARWGMWLLTLVLGVALATLLYSYFYLRLQSPIWPPETIPAPALTLPVAAALLAVVTALAMLWTKRRIAADRVGAARIGLIIALLAGAAASALLYVHMTGLPFDHMQHAYGSIFYTLSGLLLVLTVGGLGQTLFTLVWAFRGRYSGREHVAIEVGQDMWAALAAFWVITTAILYGAPYLT